MDDDSFKVKLSISADSLYVWLEKEHYVDRGLDSIEAIEAELLQNNIQKTFDREVVLRLLEEKLEFPKFNLIEAKLPVHGADGHVQWLIDVSATPKFIPDEDEDQIDFKNSMQISTIKCGQTIAELIPPQRGIAGEDIYGRTLIAKDGKPTSIKFGEGVEQKGNLILANKDGVPKFKNGMIFVDNVLTIDKNISMETGNIKTPSSITIKGNIEDGFEVICGGDLVVMGTIGASKLQVKGNIEVRGGIIGRGKGSIRCAGRIEAKFIDSMQIECDNGIYVTKDILHSAVSSLEEIIVKGSIIGGKILAMKKISARELGNELGVKTEIHIQKHFRIEKAIQISELIFQKTNLIQEKTQKWLRDQHVPPEQRAELVAMMAELAKLIQTQEAVEKEIKSIPQEDFNKLNAEIECTRRINTDVILFAPQCQKPFLEPFTIKSQWVQDLSSGTLRNLK